MNSSNASVPSTPGRKTYIDVAESENAELPLTDKLPIDEGKTHYNINIFSNSLVGAFLSPYSYTPFSVSSDENDTMYACAEAYFVTKRYEGQLDKNVLETIRGLSGHDIISMKKELAQRFHHRSDFVIEKDEELKVVLRNVLLCKFYGMIEAAIEDNTFSLDMITLPYMCYLTKAKDGAFVDTEKFKQLHWMAVVVNRACESLASVAGDTSKILEKIKNASVLCTNNILFALTMQDIDVVIEPKEVAKEYYRTFQ